MRFIIIVFIVLVTGCNYVPSVKVQPNALNQSTNILTPEQADSTLRVQLNEYYLATFSGDTKTIFHYMYPEVFVWLQGQDPEGYSLSELEDSHKLIAEDMKQWEKDNNTKLKIEINDIVKRVAFNSDKLFLVITSLTSEQGIDEISIGEKVIAISTDNGSNWKFLRKDEDYTKDILRMKYPSGIIDMIMEN